MTFGERMVRHFDRRAPRYDNPLTRFIGEQELRAIRPSVPAGSTVLDYGCGTGRTALDHLRRDCRVTAFDFSQGMIAIAEARARAESLEGEFTTDPVALADRRWPIVTCIGVLDYYADPRPLLTTLRGYLSLNGRLVVTFPNALSPLGWLYALGSRFTFPAIPRTPGFARRVAAQSGLRALSLRHAFPSLPPFGHTLIVTLAASESE